MATANLTQDTILSSDHNCMLSPEIMSMSFEVYVAFLPLNCTLRPTRDRSETITTVSLRTYCFSYLKINGKGGGEKILPIHTAKRYCMHSV